MAPDTTNNSYSLDVDGANCYVVGDSQIPANTWTWVDYQNGTTTSKINLTLTAGTHSLKLVGREPNTAVDRVILASDTACVPVGTGDNCAVNVDQTPPLVDLTTPAVGATLSGKVNVTATATDESGIAKVEFYVDSVLKSTATTSPYAYSWDTATISDGSHTVLAKAFDKTGITGTDSATVTVKNTDTTAPTAPTNLTATASGPTVVDLKWNASTDNVGVVGYYVQRNNVTIATMGTTTTYKDSTAIANTAYTYRIIAIDAASNTSQPSVNATVTTPNPSTADTQAPSVPSGISAVAASASQINVKWSASTDNVGVAKYNVYRSTNTGSATKIATVTTTSFGDSGLSANKTYKYYVIAEDAAGNKSAASTTVSATTNKQGKKGRITGKVTTSSGNKLAYAHVEIWVNGSKRLYHTRQNGTYDIPRLPAGTYKVKYSSHERGFRSQTYSITVVEDQAVTKNVSLKK